MNYFRVVSWTVIGALVAVALGSKSAVISKPEVTENAIVGGVLGLILGLSLNRITEAVKRKKNKEQPNQAL